MTRQPVIIIGAGPTGLMMACELAHFGIPFRIIDKNPKRVTTSNATWVQPRSLELLEILGIATRFVKLGHHCNAIHLHWGSKFFFELPTEHIDSFYSYLLILPQCETERLLIEHLAEADIHVERFSELLDVIEKNNTVISTIRHHDGKIENNTTEWLIACDGVNSTVRAKLNMPFFGKNTITEQFIVADAQMDSFVTNTEVHMFFDKKTVLIVYPLGSNKYRIGANLHQSHPRKFFIEKEVREIVNERGHGLYDVHSVTWISPFWVHGKIVQNMRQGAVFFAGDAAHVFPPAIGQGMNSGLQDAVNLAWKLALVIQKKAKTALLDTYHEERFPVINSALNQSDELTIMALSDKNFPAKLRKFYENFSKKKIKSIKKIGNDVSQLSIEYTKSPIIQYLGKKIKKHLKPGMRAPDVILGKHTRLYHYFHRPEHYILLFTGDTMDKEMQIKLKKMRHIEKIFPNLVKVYIVSIKPLDKENVIQDHEGLIHEQYHVKNPSLFLIRPDTYIAYYSKKLNRQPVIDFLSRYLLVEGN